MLMKKMLRKCNIVGLSLIILSSASGGGYSQALVPQTAGSQEKIDQDIKKQHELEKRIIKERREEKIQEVIKEKKVPAEEEKKIFINTIEVKGVTLLSQEVIDEIIFDYQGKELTLYQMQKICDFISDKYRKKGYVTSWAYLPPQAIKEGILVIMVIEGQVGDIQIQENKFFRTSLLKKKLSLVSGEPFDYFSLQKSLRQINEAPDREARIVLVPGKTAGTTDIIMVVKDRFPLRYTFEYDNFGSRYIEKDRYSAIAEHNNFLGFDDRFYIKYQESQASLYELKQMGYTFPWGDSDYGCYYSRNKTRLGREFKDLKITGWSEIAGIFFSHRIVNEYDFELKVNLGFDYKHILNFTGGIASSRDEARVFKAGFDVDRLDNWGRTIFTLEGDAGIPDILGGVEAKDSFASRQGAGGRFYKLVSNLYRVQPMPFSSALLLKNQFQFSNYNLLSVEQFQIGGVTNVRGYPPAEYSGDRGAACSLEWSFPPYGISQTAIIPWSETYIYDSIRFILFYDLATTRLNRALAGEEKHRTLKGCGFGVRFNVGENFSVRFDGAYPLGNTPSDGDHFHPYVSGMIKF